MLPFPPTKPVGGAKIMYEYGNRLQKIGHQVTILHSIRRPFKKMRSPLFWKQFIFWLTNAKRPGWFQLDKKIRSLVVPEITECYLPDADVTLSTWWQMTYMITRLPKQKGIPFNLVQDYEIWAGHEELVHQSYQLPVHHLVIAKYLQELLLKETGQMPEYIPNAIDTSVFSLNNPVHLRNNQSVIMLFSQEQRKGSTYGIEALVELKKEFPSLTVTLFGVYEKPPLPEWMNYVRKPKELIKLYNEHAIFLSPSLGEGWALPPAEAMACGCAVVCTNIGGHADYAIDGKTALLTTAGSSQSIIEQMRILLSNETKRIEMAKAGHQHLTSNFNWEHSVQQLENCFFNALSKHAK
mgnify:FL=1